LLTTFATIRAPSVLKILVAHALHRRSPAAANARLFVDVIVLVVYISFAITVRPYRRAQ
jgi:hypothetical protein